ncbi:uncharacterized protein [Chironomus tepperi]|uniref:uncharacterized protein n=1 Tax=Chironomus tepperi TaxID=113505 RepID=UPI00391F11AE
MVEQNWSAYTRTEKSGIIVARISQFEALLLITGAFLSLEIDIRILLEPCNPVEDVGSDNATQPISTAKAEAYTSMHRLMRIGSCAFLILTSVHWLITSWMFVKAIRRELKYVYAVEFIATTAFVTLAVIGFMLSIFAIRRQGKLNSILYFIPAPFLFTFHLITIFVSIAVFITLRRPIKKEDSIPFSYKVTKEF